MTDDQVIKIGWMKFCSQAFDQANIRRRLKYSATPKSFPLDRVRLKTLVKELRALLKEIKHD